MNNPDQPPHLLLLVVVCLSFCGCQPEGPYYGQVNPPKGQQLRIGLGASPETLDPCLAVGAPEENIIINMFEGLTEYDPETTDPVPALAERWDISSDATVYTFHLRRNARWSNNDPVTASDFVYSWRRVLDPVTASPLASLLYPIRNAAGFNQGKVRLRDVVTGHFLKDHRGHDLVLTHEQVAAGGFDPQRYHPAPITAGDVGVEARDDHTLRVILGQPTAYFLSLTPHSAFRPVHRLTVQRWGNQWTSPDHIVVNGPFTLVSWQPGDKLYLRKNHLYWGASHTIIEEATYYLAENARALLNLYRVGEIDALVTGLLPLQQLAELSQKKDYVTGPFLTLYFFLLNVTTPPLSKKEVRYALNLGLNRRQICSRLLRGGQRPAYSLLPRQFTGLNSEPRGLRFSPSKAKELMEQAGYPNGRGVKLRVTFNSLDLNRQIAEAMQAQWLDVFPEMEVELVNQEWQVYLSTMQEMKFDIIRRNWTADYNDPYSFLELMRSHSSGNYTGWTNPSYDRLLSEANSVVDQKDRFMLLAKAERLLIEDLPFIPIYEGVSFFLRKPYVRNWNSNLLDKHPLRFVWIDQGWADRPH